jgi:MoaA/NifB/PqqE/SkfB family radical SAM enzyme
MTYVLDGHKLPWHMDRVEAWERGERIAPVTMDVAWGSFCNARCSFCAAAYQTGQRAMIPTRRIKMLLEDAAEIGVRGMVTMSDGESTLHPFWAESIQMGKGLGMDMAAASNGLCLTPVLADRVLSYLTYLRINFSAGEPKRYAEIMGVPERWFHLVAENIRHMVAQKKELGLGVTINISMVLHPSNADQVIPFASLGRELGVDYAIIKHCLDYQGAPLRVDYSEYEKLQPLISEAERLTTENYLVVAKHRMMASGAVPQPDKCCGPQFLLQVSGTGLLAACGPLFGPQYAEKYHIGNICETRLKDLFWGPRYAEVMSHLQGEEFARTRPCRNYLCVQRHINEALDGHIRGNRIQPAETAIDHVNFI